MVQNYFLQLYTDNGGAYQPWLLPSGRFPLLSAEENNKLCSRFTAKEIWNFVFEMGAFKAPGPDGYQALFFQKHWDLVGNQLTLLALDVLSGRAFPGELNETFLVLIPKIENPQSVTELRPVGLCNVAYKVITRAIVNRLKPILCKLVAPTQCSFVPNRQISDNIIVVQEMLHTMRRKKGAKGYMAIKLDLEKAYDWIRSPFLRETLMDLRLPQLLIESS